MFASGRSIGTPKFARGIAYRVPMSAGAGIAHHLRCVSSVIAALTQAEAGVKVAELVCDHRSSEATFHNW